MVTEKCRLVKQPVNVRGDNESVRRKTWIERVFSIEDTYIPNVLRVISRDRAR